MTTDRTDPRLPPGLTPGQRGLLTDLLRRGEADHAENLLGVVLCGSAGRGLATARSDLDVFVVLAETGAPGPATSRSATLDETLVAIADLERVPPFERHPLPSWRAGELLGLLTATLDGEPSAIRAAFRRVETLCAAFDSARPEPVLTPVIAGWGDDLRLVRG